jgi:uncharacterized protein YecT (DUF1311 family)
MTLLRTVVLASVVFPLGALAQDLPFTPEATEACLAAADVAPADCIGASAGVCMDSPDGYTTVGMSMCLGKEVAYWEDRLNAAYGTLLAMEEAVEADLRAIGSSAPSPAEALGAMQSAWIAFRDASCLYEYSQWGGGTGGGPAGADCTMRMTGAQALMLESLIFDRQQR